MVPTVPCPHCQHPIILDPSRLLAWKQELEKQPGAIETLRALLPAHILPPQQPQLGPIRSLLKGLGL